MKTREIEQLNTNKRCCENRFDVVDVVCENRVDVVCENCVDVVCENRVDVVCENCVDVVEKMMVEENHADEKIIKKFHVRVCFSVNENTLKRDFFFVNTIFSSTSTRFSHQHQHNFHNNINTISQQNQHELFARICK